MTGYCDDCGNTLCICSLAKESEMKTNLALMIEMRDKWQAYHRESHAMCEKLASALEDAIGSIHSEYCGQQHHRVCKRPNSALTEYRDWKEK